MYQEERLIEILQHLKKHKRISIEDICEQFEVSRDTARRDLVKLDEQGAIVRTRGGAILPALSKEVSSYEQRLKHVPEAKKEIAKRAVSLIKDYEYLILDASTTVEFIADYLQTKQNSIVTNSIQIASTLSKKEVASIHLLGGQLHHSQQYIYGAAAIEMLRNYHVDKLFLGACGITQSGLSTPYEEEGLLVKEMIKRANQVIVLADQSKFGKQMFYNVCPLEDIDIIVTYCSPDDSFQSIVDQYEIELLTTRGV
ncbi:DeoR/GlpR family DNA-binding transcription regulator [Priestia abyssalis]|uniref:DeoR/GlpR family DNA-binding transcription regulator n=1 Tax=Priestia abyssalis TaxID=1221450 RepID=UPI000995B819|nr:DeoR/GlpR family DNA-binding transcription regulator [Priestia abyssalis]